MQSYKRGRIISRETSSRIQTELGHRVVSYPVVWRRLPSAYFFAARISTLVSCNPITHLFLESIKLNVIDKLRRVA